jgi:hypothetical protein
MGAELKHEFEQLRQDVERRFEAVEESIRQWAERMHARFDGLAAEVERRFDLFENRLDRMDSLLAGMEINFSSFHKELDGHERYFQAYWQAAQQKAIDNIVDRLFGLEHRQ